MSNSKALIEVHSNDAKIATEHDKVYKDECVYSYDTPESEHGLFVCLNTFIGLSKRSLYAHHLKTNSHLYLNIKTFRKEVPDNFIIKVVVVKILLIIFFYIIIRLYQTTMSPIKTMNQKRKNEYIQRRHRQEAGQGLALVEKRVRPTRFLMLNFWRLQPLLPECPLLI